jgi:hypothetical protein
VFSETAGRTNVPFDVSDPAHRIGVDIRWVRQLRKAADNSEMSRPKAFNCLSSEQGGLQVRGLKRAKVV